ncbi:MAG TPA: hypothetical protein VEF07_08855 [Candidatus Binataceae bacterium]|nr:hypothetical protein [Candidatus Binataceae bacterium]
MLFAAVIVGVCGNVSAAQPSAKRVNPANGTITIKPLRLDFGLQAAGVTSTTVKTVTLRNLNPRASTIDAVEVAGNYSVANNTCSGRLAPNGKCQITLAITPRCPVAQPGTLSIFHDSSSTPETVRLSGRGKAPSGASSNEVLVAGGLNLKGPLASAELFDPGSCKFSAIGNMTMPRAFQTATYLDPAVVSGPEAGWVLITGGQTDELGDITAAAELYDPLTRTFSATVQTMTHARAGHSATLMRSGPLAGKVLIIGGEALGADGFRATASAEIYDPNSGSFTPTTGAMNVARSQHRATLISGCNCAQDGDILVTGGYAVDPGGGPNDTAEIFDPANQTFSCVGGGGAQYACADVMSSSRWEHAAAMLSNGTVWIGGGEITDNRSFPGKATATTDIYNPATGMMTRGPDMHLARNGEKVAVIPSGTLQNQVLVTGGFGDQVHATGSTAELYNPASNSFQCVGKNAPLRAKLCPGSMVDPRGTQAVTGFSGGALDGLVLVSGGINLAQAAVLNTAEVFNPSINGFERVGNMVSPRNEHTVTELPQ